MWILDSAARDGIDLWEAGGGKARRHRIEYAPPFYVHLPDPHLHGEMLEALEARYRAHECRFTTIFGDLDGYAVYGDRATAGRIEQQSGFSAQMYNVDVRRDQQYMAEQGIFPCGHPGESRFSLDLDHLLSILEIRIPGNPAAGHTINAAETLFEGEPERFSGTERQVLSDLFSVIETMDPDAVLCPDADRWMPLVVRKTRNYGIPFTLSRTGTYRKMDARSYWSYGRMEHREGAVIPFGRILIDTEQSFVFREGGLTGVLIGARLSGLSPNLVSRFTPGTLISSYEVYEALRRGIAVPFRKSDPENVRRFGEIKAADKGGMMFQPGPGVYETVHEIDFTSLYPSIIVQFNLSPETIEHPEKEGFLATVLGPLLDMRIQTKQQKKRDPACAGIDSVLKWMLVTCFGYTGYRNAKFGRIEVHERITGISRKILLRTKDIAEEMGFTVLHGIVDCLWVQGYPVDELKARIERETRLRTEIEEYSWLVFLPLADGRFGAYNRYYGRLTDGSIKVRGIAARRHDTPEYIRRMQKEMLEVMSGAGSAAALRACEERVRELYRRAAAGIRAADPHDFCIRRRISRLTYTHRCLEASAVRAYQAAGAPVAPGVEITYVVRDAERYSVDPEWEAAVIDVKFYRDLLDKAWKEIAYPFDGQSPRKRERAADQE